MTFARLVAVGGFLFCQVVLAADAASTPPNASALGAPGESAPAPILMAESAGAAVPDIRENQAPAPTAPVASVPAPGVFPPAPSTGSSSTPDLSKALFGLVFVLALMAGAVWLMKRMGVVKAGAGSVGRIVGGVSVGNRERVVVVEIGDQWIVVGVAPGRVSPLAQLPRQEPVETGSENAPGGPNFADWLKQTIDKRSGGSSR